MNIKLKDIEINLRFLLGGFLLFAFCVWLGITGDILLLAMILFLVGMVLFIIFELILIWIDKNLQTKGVCNR